MGFTMEKKIGIGQNKSYLPAVVTCVVIFQAVAKEVSLFPFRAIRRANWQKVSRKFHGLFSWPFLREYDSNILKHTLST